jgi:hypothetical protein
MGNQSGALGDVEIEFPQLVPAEVYDALWYYYDHQSEVGAEIVGLTDLTMAMRDHPPTLRPGHGSR